MLAGYYLIVNPLVTIAINFGYTPVGPIKSQALAFGVTWWALALTMVGFCPINKHLTGSLIMWQITE